MRKSEEFIADFKDIYSDETWWDKGRFKYSYSSIAQDYPGKRSPKEDFELIKDKFIENGWTYEELVDVCKRNRVEICRKLVNDSSGAFDYFLYHLTDKLFPLSGYSLMPSDDWEFYSECHSKYLYGWHNTEYGKIYLRQCGLTKGTLINGSSKYIIFDIVDDLSIKYKDHFYGETRVKKLSNKIRKYLKKGIVRNKLIVDYKVITEMINVSILMTGMNSEYDMFKNSEIKSVVLQSIDNRLGNLSDEMVEEKDSKFIITFS